MAVIKAVSSRAGIGQALDYVTKREKTEDKLVTGIACEPETAEAQMQLTKELWSKTDGRTYKHFVQSYHEDEQITPEQAHANALELAKGTKAWQGHEVLIATHIDKGHIHSHFIVNSVNYETGYKLQWSKADLQDLKDRCNEQSRAQGLHIPEKGRTFEGEEREETTAWTKEAYQKLKQAELGSTKSYVQDIALAVMDCRETATSRAEFVEQMKERGYGVEWQDNRKYITFVDLDRQEHGEKQCKVRNNKLEQYYAVDFGKEDLEHGFETNARSRQEYEAEREFAERQLAHSQADRADLRAGDRERPVQGAGRDSQQGAGAGETVSELLRSISAERSNQRTAERQSAEVRDDKVSQRADRDAIRERQRAAAERKAKIAEQLAAEREARRAARSRDHGISR